MSELAREAARPRPALRLLVTSQAPLEVDGAHLVELGPLGADDAAELFALRATSRPSQATTESDDRAVLDLCRSLDGLPLAIELAAARTRTLTVEEISRRLDDRFAVLNDPTQPPARARRSLRSTIGWSYDLLFPDDQRGLWALATFAGGAPLAAVELVLAALEVPASAAIDVVGRLVGRSLVIVEDDVGSDAGTARLRYRLLDSIRAFALESMDGGRALRHSRWQPTRRGTPMLRGCPRPVCAVRHRLSTSPSRAPNGPTSMPPSRGAAPTTLRSLSRSPPDSAGPGWCSATAAAPRGSWSRWMPVGDNGDPLRRADAMLLAGWIEASSGDLEPARQHVDAADRARRDARRPGPAGPLRLLPGLRRLPPRRVPDHALDAHRPQPGALRRAGPALGPGRQRPVRRSRRDLRGRPERSESGGARGPGWLRLVDDPWLRARGEAVLGELARIRHRFDDAVVYLGQRGGRPLADSASSRPRPISSSSLGRAQCQAGDYAAGAVHPWSWAIGKAEATGDVRLAALARVHLGRVLRAEGDTVAARSVLEQAAAWHRKPGGGEQAALGECLLAALDAADGRFPVARDRLLSLLSEARLDGRPTSRSSPSTRSPGWRRTTATLSVRKTSWRERPCGWRTPTHFVTEHDRTDAAWVRGAG